MVRKRDIFITSLFCGFIGIMVIGLIFLPKENFSSNEKRTLAQFPKISATDVLSGKWENDFEEYISDHFPKRNFFVSLDSYYMLSTGRNGSNGVYKGQDGYLINIPVKCDEEKFKDNLNAILNFSKNTEIKTDMMIVPSTGSIMTEKLPKIHTEYNDEKIISEAENYLSGNVDMIDLHDKFNSVKNDIQLYYKTDHHWTEDGAYTAYSIWAKKNDINIRNKDDYIIEKTENFYGTTYTKSALWHEKPDTLEVWSYPINVTVTVENVLYNDMFFREHLKNEDKYPVFLDGNHGYERIENHDNPNGKKILVIKDSFAHSFVPFMAENCSMIDMVDLRYYLTPVSLLTEQNDYDEILILCGISTLCESNDLSILQ